MDDLISRKAAIDAIMNEVEPFAIVEPGTTCVIGIGVNNKDVVRVLEQMPTAAPSTAQTTETTAPTTDDWIPVERELPEDLAEVNVTWVNHEPEPYYEHIKSKPFTASAVYYEGKWYWYSSVCADVLAEYGRNDVDKVDDTIEITAWRPFPEPYRGGEK